jgi:hypothetical protein
MALVYFKTKQNDKYVAKNWILPRPPGYTTENYM